MSAEQSLRNSYTYVGILLILEGLLFLISPHLNTKLLFLLPIQTAQAEQYARALGLTICVIGYYYIAGGKYATVGFFKAGIIARLSILPIILVMIYLWSIEVPFIIFGIQDIVTAIWSYSCLQAYKAEQGKLKK